MKILVDLDDVVADLQGRVESLWSDIHPDVPLFPGGIRERYYIGAGHTREYVSEIYHLMHGPGFYSSLNVKPGAKEALEQMIELGHQVFIVTSSGVSYPLAATEKYQWVEQYLGQHMLAHLVITPVKYIVGGDILIDDKPEIHLEEQAQWEHVLFDQPYNRYVDKRRLDWNNWRKVLDI